MIASPPDALLPPFGRWVLVLLLIAAGVWVRLPHLGEDGIGFHPGRQYRSGLMAQGLAWPGDQQAPEWRRAAGRAWFERNRPLEPPVAEWITARGWRLLGEAPLALPRALSALVWLLGVLALHRLARGLFGPDAALAASGFLLLAPFAAPASASFQPDPWMIAWTCLGLLGIERLAGATQRPDGGTRASTRRVFCWAAFACAVALVLKPVAIFPLGVGGVARLWSARGLRGLVRDPRVWAFCAIAGAPAFAWYAWGIFGAGFLRNQAEGSFHPDLLATTKFWGDWGRMLGRSVGTIPIALGLVGVMVARGPARVWLVGLWSGHLLYGMCFTHHTATHDYYQLPLFPTVALSWAALAGCVLGSVRGSRTLWAAGWATTVVAVGVAAVLLSPWRERRSSAIELAIFDAVGAEVEHSTRVVTLAGDLAKPVQFHGEFAAWNWPSSRQIEAMRRAGRELAAPSELVLELTGGVPPDWFCVVLPRDLERQPRLAEWLEQFPARGPERQWRVYDLRGGVPEAPSDDSPAAPAPGK